MHPPLQAYTNGFGARLGFHSTGLVYRGIGKDKVTYVVEFLDDGHLVEQVNLTLSPGASSRVIGHLETSERSVRIAGHL